MSQAIEVDTYYPLSYGFDAADFENSISEAWGGHLHIRRWTTRIHGFWADVQSDPLPIDLNPIVQCWAEGPILNDLADQYWAPELTAATGWTVEAEVERDGELETVASTRRRTAGMAATVMRSMAQKMFSGGLWPWTRRVVSTHLTMTGLWTWPTPFENQ